jgi:uncharacterized membrane protein
MRTVKLYSKEDCHLCDEAKLVLDVVARQMPLRVEEVDIEPDPVLNQLFAEHVPVLDLGEGTRLYWPFEAGSVLEALNGMAATGEEALSRPGVGGRTRNLVIGVDRVIYHFARHWVAVLAFFLGLYVGLPLLAPILMANGYTAPANLIYSAYRFACHQLPSRSYFIFGHQVAFCHRDVAIYTALFTATVLFAFVRRRLKPLSWQGYVAFIAPMALDGITQLSGLRTSNWQLRTITGALFGLGSAWLALPYVEEAFADIRQSVSQTLHLE